MGIHPKPGCRPEDSTLGMKEWVMVRKSVKRKEWYESGHFLPDEAFQHMVEWLAGEVGIDASRFTGP
jgi:hypothetical protein